MNKKKVDRKEYVSNKPLSIIFKYDTISKIVNIIEDINAEVEFELNYEQKTLSIYTTLSENSKEDNDLYLYLRVIDVTYNIKDRDIYEDNKNINFIIKTAILKDIISSFSKFNFIELLVFNNLNFIEFYSEISKPVFINHNNTFSDNNIIKTTTVSKSKSNVIYYFQIDLYKDKEKYIYLGLIDIGILNSLSKVAIDKYKISDVKVIIKGDSLQFLCEDTKINEEYEEKEKITIPNLLSYNIILDYISKYIKTTSIYKIKNFNKISNDIEIKILNDKVKSRYIMIIYPKLSNNYVNKIEVFYMIKLNDKLLK